MFGFDVLVESKDHRKDVSFTLLLMDKLPPINFGIAGGPSYVMFV